jgi:hypothetical protein
MNITDIQHPIYQDSILDWFKWRLAYEGGRQFVEHYTKKFSTRENNTDFVERKSITPCPRFAGAAIDEVKNSIYQRMVDITRNGGTSSYQKAILGHDSGVDLLGSSMNSFVGRKVLPELLTMKKVGIYVDMPVIQTPLMLNRVQSKRPYIYLYTAEDILSWTMDESSSFNEFSSVLLREQQYECCETTGLPTGITIYYKHFWIEYDEDYVPYVYCCLYDSQSRPIVMDTSDESGIIKLNIPKIPFVCLEISHSLMSDIADYQIALLNMMSSDISYSLKANFPFYTEQYDPRATSPYTKSDIDETTDKQEIDIGPTSGRRYPIGTNRPEFIYPSSEPLFASMRKQEQLKEEIRLLVNLSVTNIQPRQASAESKGFDERSLESGLSYIALELENAERQIGEIWSMYEKSNNIPTVKYPDKYNLKTDEDRRKDAEQYNKLKGEIPSKTYQKEVAKIVANILLGNRVSDNTLNKISSEIDNALVISIPSEVIAKDIEQGIVSLETASQVRGYPSGEVEKAKKDHAERIARIKIAQSSGGGEGNVPISSNDIINPDSRGVPDLSMNPNGAQNEKTQSRDTTLDKTVTTKVRGKSS